MAKQTVRIISETKTVHGPLAKGKFNEHLDYAIGKGWMMHGAVDHFVHEGEPYAATTLVKVKEVEVED